MTTVQTQMLTPEARAARYLSQWPDRPAIQVHKGCLYGVWLIGATYKRDMAYYGAYPHGILDRLLALFPETPRLHLFSGMVRDVDPGAETFDINPGCRPSVIGDVMNISEHFSAEHFATVLADPPYSARARIIYGTDNFDKRLALREVWQVMQPGGVLAWLDVITPIWSKELWTWGGLIGLQTGTNCVMRALSILVKRGD